MALNSSTPGVERITMPSSVQPYSGLPGSSVFAVARPMTELLVPNCEAA